MKVGFVLDDTLDSTDGVQQYILLLGSWLSDHGHEVHYLTSTSERQDVDNLHAIASHLRLKFNRNVVPLVVPTSPKRIAEVLSREQFDVLHVQMPFSPAFGARIISLAPKTTAIVGTFHIAPYSLTEKALSKVLGYWLKPTHRLFDAVMSVSKPAQQLAKEAFGISSLVVPNMVDVKSYKLSKKLNRHHPTELIFLGRLVERKGCEHFIRSLALLDEPFRATIVGDGNQKETLEKLVLKLKLSNSVSFEGFVSEAKKRKLLAESDIAVFPSTGGESFGIVLIEAMSAGSCIVLAGDNPGYRSVLSSLPESLIQPTNHQSFAVKLAESIKNEAKARNLYTDQQELVKQFDVNVVAQKVLETYKTAIAKRSQKSHTTK